MIAGFLFSYGINTQTPQQTLDVNGIARAQQFVYSTEQTHNLSLPVDAFTSDDPAAYQTYRSDNPTDELWLYKGTAGQQGFISAPVYLPDGATVTNLEITAKDNDGTSIAPSATLTGVGLVAPIGIVIQSVAGAYLTAESADLQTASVAVNQAIDNNQYSYKVVVKLNQNSANTILFKVRITYTVSSPD